MDNWIHIHKIHGYGNTSVQGSNADILIEGVHKYMWSNPQSKDNINLLFYLYHFTFSPSFSRRNQEKKNHTLSDLWQTLPPSWQSKHCKACSVKSEAEKNHPIASPFLILKIRKVWSDKTTFILQIQFRTLISSSLNNEIKPNAKPSSQ